MNQRPLFALGALLACVWPATDAHAAVFMRLGRGAQALEQLGGTLLQNGDVRINGQPGKLAVYGFDTAPASLAPDLRKAVPLPELKTSGASLTTHVANGQATTLLLLPGAGPYNSVVLLIEQSADAYRKIRETPAAWPGGLAYPGASPFFSAENEQTRTTLAVATTTDTPDAAADRMNTALTGSGWSRVPPQTATPGLTFYSRGNRICAFSAITASDDPGGRTRITVLQLNGVTP